MSSGFGAKEVSLLRPVLELTPALALLLLGGCAKLQRDPVQFVSGTQCVSQDVDQLVRQAAVIGPHTQTGALQCQLSALRTTRRSSAQSCLLASRVCLLLATRESDQSKRERLAAEGVGFAEKALAQGGEGHGEVHYYLAANLGFVVRDDMTLAVQNLPRLREEMNRALALSPDVDDGGPLRLLGMLYLKAPPWPAGFGDGDKAVELLRQAVERHPEHPLNHLFLGQAMYEVDGEDAADRAKQQWAAGIRLLQQGNWGYNREPWLREFELVRREFEEPGT